MKKLFLFTLITCCSLASSSIDSLGSSIQTSFGLLSIEKGSSGFSLLLDGKEIKQEESLYSMEFVKHFKFAEYESVLAMIEEGDKWCPSKFFLITFKGNSLPILSINFGCVSEDTEIIEEGDAVTFKFPGDSDFKLKDGELSEIKKSVFTENYEGSIEGRLGYASLRFTLITNDNKVYIVLVYDNDWDKFLNLNGERIIIKGTISIKSNGIKEIEPKEVILPSESLSEESIPSENIVSSLSTDTSPSEGKVKKSNVAEILIFIGIFLVILVIIYGIYLGIKDKAIFYYDSRDLFLSFSPLLFLITGGILIFLIDDSRLKNVVSSISVVIVLISAFYVIFRSIRFNGKAHIGIVVALAKIFLSFLVFVKLLAVIKPSGITDSEKQSRRMSAFFWLAVLSPLVYRLINGQRVLIKNQNPAQNLQF